MNSLITREEILSYKDKIPEVDSALFDRVHKYIWMDGEDKYITKLRSLPIGYQTIYDSIAIEGEIFNGGFSQYFSNSTAEEHHDSGVKAFRRIGAGQVAALLEEAFELVLKASNSFRTSCNIEGIQNVFNNIRDAKIDFKELDQKFYNITDNVENLGNLRVGYIFTNLQDFKGQLTNQHRRSNLHLRQEWQLTHETLLGLHLELPKPSHPSHHHGTDHHLHV